MYITHTNSTNTLLKELLAKGEWPEGESFLRAGYQSAGRGQTGNSWESEADKNLLCSILLPPDQEPFFLNVAVSVALHRVVAEAIWLTTLETEADKPLRIKWPNDLYYGDKKIAGVLIENAILGNKVQYSIAGIGLNVNQTEWQSDAPNPLSLKTLCEAITGEKEELDIADLMDALDGELRHVLIEPRDLTWWYYKSHLYRSEGMWPFVEREVTTAPTMNADAPAQGQFDARIEDVLPTGEIVLRDAQDQQRTYHFKQVRYVII